MAKRVHLDREADVQSFLAQRDHPVEQRFPVAVAGEIVVGDEEALDALRDIRADDGFQIVRRAETALAPLHVYDGAERALIGTAASEIDAGQRTRRAAHVLLRQDRRRLALQRRQVVHEVVQRRQRRGPGIADHAVEPAFLGLAGEEGDAERLRFAQFRGHIRQHRKTARHMKTADGDREACLQEWAGQVHRARELVALHAHQRNQHPAAGADNLANDAIRTDAPIRLVIGVETNLDARAQHGAALRILTQRIETGQRVRRNGRPEPLNRVAIVVVVRWLDHDEVEKAGVAMVSLSRHYSFPVSPAPPAALSRMRNRSAILQRRDRTAASRQA